jgi:SAM-dependent methyltransferase
MKTGSEYFERMWTTDDPWRQRPRFSEHRKFELTVSSLPRARYNRAFEPGCGTGLLTARLADRCDSVVAMDRHPRAVEVTRRTVAHLRNVEVSVGALPDVSPGGGFDLIVYSELLYYLDERDVVGALELAADVSTPDAQLVAVHYRPFVSDHALRGDAVHDIVVRHPRWRRVVHHIEIDFVLDVCERA